MQQEVNIGVGNKAPVVYFNEVKEQTKWDYKIQGINDNELIENLKHFSIHIYNGYEDYDRFLQAEGIWQQK